MAWARRKRFSSFRRGAKRRTKYELQNFVMPPEQFVMPYGVTPDNPLNFFSLICHPRLEWGTVQPGEFTPLPVPPVAKGVVIGGLRHRINVFAVWNQGGDTADLVFPIYGIAALVVLPTDTELAPLVNPNLFRKGTANSDDRASGAERPRILFRAPFLVEAYNGDPFAAGVMEGPQGWGMGVQHMIRTKSRVQLGMDHGLFLQVCVVNPVLAGETLFLQASMTAVLAVKQSWSGNSYL